MSCPFNVQIIRQTTTSIQLKWSSIDDCDVYKVIKLKDAKPTDCNRNVRSYWLVFFWNVYFIWVIYSIFLNRGTNAECIITGLYDNFCYAFQVYALQLNFSNYVPIKTSQIICVRTSIQIWIMIVIFNHLQGQYFTHNTKHGFGASSHSQITRIRFKTDFIHKCRIDWYSRTEWPYATLQCCFNWQ